jgi:hypothetical protein
LDLSFFRIYTITGAIFRVRNLSGSVIFARVNAT